MNTIVTGEGGTVPKEVKIIDGSYVSGLYKLITAKNGN